MEIAVELAPSENARHKELQNLGNRDVCGSRPLRRFGLFLVVALVALVALVAGRKGLAAMAATRSQTLNNGGREGQSPAGGMREKQPVRGVAEIRRYPLAAPSLLSLGRSSFFPARSEYHLDRPPGSAISLPCSLLFSYQAHPAFLSLLHRAQYSRGICD